MNKRALSNMLIGAGSLLDLYPTGSKKLIAGNYKPVRISRKASIAGGRLKAPTFRRHRAVKQASHVSFSGLNGKARR